MSDDIDTVVALLTNDAWLAMPPAPHRYHGPSAIAGFLRASAAWRRGRRLRLLPVAANRQTGFACYIDDPGTASGRWAGLLVLATAGERVSGLTRFLGDRLYERFGMPSTLDSLL